jgi:hypothetical protein
MLDGIHKDQTDYFNIIQTLVIQSANGRPIDLNVSVRQPTQILAFAIVSALNFHVGTEWQWWPSRLIFAQIVVKIQVANFVELVGAQNVSSLRVGVGDASFGIVNVLDIGDACEGGREAMEDYQRPEQHRGMRRKDHHERQILDTWGECGLKDPVGCGLVLFLLKMKVVRWL